MNDRPSLPNFQMQYKWKLTFFKSLSTWFHGGNGMERTQYSLIRSISIRSVPQTTWTWVKARISLWKGTQNPKTERNCSLGLSYLCCTPGSQARHRLPSSFLPPSAENGLAAEQRTEQKLKSSGSCIPTEQFSVARIRGACGEWGWSKREIK